MRFLLGGRSELGFRTVVISSEADVHIRGGQLVVCKDDALAIPVEDVAVLTLESPRVRVSSAALALLAESGVPLVVCDRRHMPIGVLNAYCAHSRQSAVVQSQLTASLPLKKRLWQRLVIGKIENQARCLEMLSISGHRKLREYAGQVLSGDASGREAVAARYYFSRLMPNTRRHSGSSCDAGLDYGYAVVRACVARSLVAHGLYPPIGIHHASQLNAFNLADDLLEPFRPCVDLVVNACNADVGSIDGRASIAGVLNQSCEVAGGVYTVNTAVEAVVQTLVTAMDTGRAGALSVPRLLPLGDSAKTLAE